MKVQNNTKKNINQQKKSRNLQQHLYNFTFSDKIFRDFIYINDVIQANIYACKPKNSGIYNVGSGIPRNFQEIADTLQKELKTDLGTEYFPNPYNGYQLNTQADISKTKENLSFEPKFSLEKGIADYVPEIVRLFEYENL